jgi:hypothetical protein
LDKDLSKTNGARWMGNAANNTCQSFVPMPQITQTKDSQITLFFFFSLAKA